MNQRLTLTVCVAAVLSAIGIVPRVSAQGAMLVGTVLVDPTERPIAQAEISIADLKLTARSDSVGNFQITGLTAGRHEVTIRMVGYESVTSQLVFGATQKIEADFLLKPIVTKLVTVDVSAKAAIPLNSRLVEFEERRKVGTGKYIAQDVFEKYNSRATADIILSTLSGMHGVSLGSGERVIASSRGPNSLNQLPQGDKTDQARGAKADCFVQVVVNGVVRYRSEKLVTLFDINSIPAREIIGFEYYTTAQTPSLYNGTGSQCGTVLIWTK